MHAVAADFKTHLDRLKTTQALRAHCVVILFPREKTSGKILALSSWEPGLSDDYFLEVKIVSVNFA
jgi:hypothetical protein